MGYSQKLWVISFYTDKMYWIHQIIYLIELMGDKMEISHLVLLVTIMIGLFCSAALWENSLNWLFEYYNIFIALCSWQWTAISNCVILYATLCSADFWRICTFNDIRSYLISDMCRHNNLLGEEGGAQKIQQTPVQNVSHNKKKITGNGAYKSHSPFEKLCTQRSFYVEPNGLRPCLLVIAYFL